MWAEIVRVSQRFQSGIDEQRNSKYVEIPVKYDVIVNGKLSREAQYVTFVHELAHLYCGHLGTPHQQWWPDRRGLSHAHVEFEAESILLGLFSTRYR